MIFRWNIDWQKSLSVNERQQIRLHEAGHVAFAKARDDHKNQAMKELLDFSRGYPCPEPLTEVGCAMAFPKYVDGSWKIAEDRLFSIRK